MLNCNINDLADLLIFGIFFIFSDTEPDELDENEPQIEECFPEDFDLLEDFFGAAAAAAAIDGVFPLNFIVIFGAIAAAGGGGGGTTGLCGLGGIWYIFVSDFLGVAFFSGKRGEIDFIKEGAAGSAKNKLVIGDAAVWKAAGCSISTILTGDDMGGAAATVLRSYFSHSPVFLFLRWPFGHRFRVGGGIILYYQAKILSFHNIHHIII